MGRSEKRHSEEKGEGGGENVVRRGPAHTSARTAKLWYKSLAFAHLDHQLKEAQLIIRSSGRVAPLYHLAIHVHLHLQVLSNGQTQHRILLWQRKAVPRGIGAEDLLVDQGELLEARWVKHGTGFGPVDVEEDKGADGGTEGKGDDHRGLLQAGLPVVPGPLEVLEGLHDRRCERRSKVSVGMGLGMTMGTGIKRRTSWSSTGWRWR